MRYYQYFNAQKLTLKKICCCLYKKDVWSEVHFFVVGMMYYVCVVKSNYVFYESLVTRNEGNTLYKNIIKTKRISKNGNEIYLIEGVI
jgi:hypothetical protein